MCEMGLMDHVRRDCRICPTQWMLPRSRTSSAFTHCANVTGTYKPRAPPAVTDSTKALIGWRTSWRIRNRSGQRVWPDIAVQLCMYAMRWLNLYNASLSSYLFTIVMLHCTCIYMVASKSKLLHISQLINTFKCKVIFEGQISHNCSCHYFLLRFVVEYFL